MVIASALISSIGDSFTNEGRPRAGDGGFDGG